MKTNNSDEQLYARFFAICALILGVPSLAWALYVSCFYPVDPVAAASRIAIGLALTLGGGFVLLRTARSFPRPAWQNHRHSFIGSRVDGLLFLLAFLALLVSLFFLPFTINNYLIARSSDGRFLPVKVRVDSIDIRHVPKNQLPLEKFYPIYKDVYFTPDDYIDLWIAFGTATLIEREGRSVEPIAVDAIFTIPHVESYGSSRQRKHYFEHYKMDAVRDSERFHVGSVVGGWILRDQESVVIFSRQSDLRQNDLFKIISLILVLSLYLVTRIRIGMILQDVHWVELKKIYRYEKP